MVTLTQGPAGKRQLLLKPLSLWPRPGWHLFLTRFGTCFGTTERCKPSGLLFSARRLALAGRTWAENPPGCLGVGNTSATCLTKWLRRNDITSWMLGQHFGG